MLRDIGKGEPGSFRQHFNCPLSLRQQFKQLKPVFTSKKASKRSEMAEENSLWVA